MKPDELNKLRGWCQPGIFLVRLDLLFKENLISIPSFVLKNNPFQHFFFVQSKFVVSRELFDIFLIKFALYC